MCRNYLQFTGRGSLRRTATVSQLGHVYRYAVAKLRMSVPARFVTLLLISYQLMSLKYTYLKRVLEYI